MKTRRDFLKRAASLTGGSVLAESLLPAIERASQIDPAPGSSYLDAEHVVVLMQENRSFDHSFGSLRGVRGFNDPRAITLPNQNPVWLQTNEKGETYAPFRLDIQRTNATWLGSLPHSWTDQTDAKNDGSHDRWLDVKKTGHKGAEGMPFTMGYYTREDLPFYYALADAFTVCDQHFCSCLTGTTPNRLYLWSGTIREQQTPDSPANVRNSETNYGFPVHWTTFPERLEDAGISWKIYQNEISCDTGLSGEHDAWLANFTDNPIEWFSQYHVQLAKRSRENLERLAASLPIEIAALKSKGDSKELQEKTAQLEQVVKDRAQFTEEAFRQLPERNRNLHAKAFTNNNGDPDYRELTTLTYMDGNAERSLQVPKGDVLYQFRKDVQSGQLPAVSWIVPPENFSDHPGAPWYGAWLLAEVLDILTHNPEVWRKTVFLLTYDENDGYFDHVPPFGVPHPGKPETGSSSEGLDTAVDYVRLELDEAKKPEHGARGGSIGLGFRVPFIAASPWSRGGFVCSQVFDHTSVLQFLEVLLSHKTGKNIRETNISPWRRTVCGDLTTIFRPAVAKGAPLPYPDKNQFIERVHKAQFRQQPGYRAMAAADVALFTKDRFASPFVPQQEKGTRPACALPYELYLDADFHKDRRALLLRMAAKKERFGERSVGSPFFVYSPGKKKDRARYYTVMAGGSLTDEWQLTDFENGVYHLCAHGPNGFFREFKGSIDDPSIEVRCLYTATGDIEVELTNGHASRSYAIEVHDLSYGGKAITKSVGGRDAIRVHLPLQKSFGWYDFSVHCSGDSAGAFRRRYAGHVETGKESHSDPAMGGVHFA